MGQILLGAYPLRRLIEFRLITDLDVQSKELMSICCDVFSHYFGWAYNEPMEELSTKDKLPSFSYSTSKIAIDILVDKKDFNEIKKTILKGRNETKQKKYFSGDLTTVLKKTKKVDALINNVGVAGPTVESFDISKIEFKIDIKKPGAVYTNVGKIAKIFAIKDFKFIKKLKYKKGKKS